MLLDLYHLYVGPLQRAPGDPAPLVFRRAARPTLFTRAPGTEHGESLILVDVVVEARPRAAAVEADEPLALTSAVDVAPVATRYRRGPAIDVDVASSTSGRRRHTPASLQRLQADDELLVLAVV